MDKLIDKGEETFKATPNVKTEAEFTQQIAVESTRRNWLNDVRGKWPGDETIDELMKELESR
jgi:hypothetical protein